MTHLTHADDLLSFALGDSPSVALLANCIESFGAIIGLKINKLKSHIYIARVNEQQKEVLWRLLDSKKGNWRFNT